MKDDLSSCCGGVAVFNYCRVGRSRRWHGGRRSKAYRQRTGLWPIRPQSTPYEAIANLPFEHNRATPQGGHANWLASAPGRGFFAILRLYGLQEAAIDYSWKPGDFQLVK